MLSCNRSSNAMWPWWRQWTWATASQRCPMLEFHWHIFTPIESRHQWTVRIMWEHVRNPTIEHVQYRLVCHSIIEIHCHHRLSCFLFDSFKMDVNAPNGNVHYRSIHHQPDEVRLIDYARLSEHLSSRKIILLQLFRTTFRRLVSYRQYSLVDDYQHDICSSRINDIHRRKTMKPIEQHSLTSTMAKTCYYHRWSCFLHA
jgi:hypothetical protein